MPITNRKMRSYKFLDGMYKDSYYPKEAVDICQRVLIRLCEKIERKKPKDLDALYRLTNAATEELNVLAALFPKMGSELETVARGIICADFAAIAKAYGFRKADHDELTAVRDW